MVGDKFYTSPISQEDEELEEEVPEAEESLETEEDDEWGEEVE